jgi:NAD(P)-dependent dehydrogenase (short-subunit alcohol dehydrogenase family)
MLLKDKVIIVTGATSGIGAATALVAAREGAKVVVAGRREDKGKAVVASIREQGGHALFVRTDVTREPEVEALVSRTVSEYGRLDGAFNNAGLPSSISPIASVPAEQYRRLMDANLDSVLTCMRYQIPAMKRTGGGSIVNCASILGIVGGPGFGAYTTSKHALLGLTKSAALDYATEGIRVNAVLPGPVETEIWSHLDNGDQALQAFTSGVPMGRHARSEEVARPVVFLLSDWASYMTGVELIIDGGYTVR